MIFNDCRDCKKYKGNCGNHHIDTDNHIHYDIPSEAYMMNVLGEHGSCFEPSDDYNQTKKQKLAMGLSEYSIETLEMALEIAQKKENKE